MDARSGFGTEYSAHLPKSAAKTPWNLCEFTASVGKLGYELILKAMFRGYSFDAAAPLPTEHFDLSQRLSYFSQLILRRFRTS